MANASINSVSQTDSASAHSDHRKRFTLGNNLGPSQTVQSILFDTLFTSQFFESALTQTSVEPETSLLEPVAMEPVDKEAKSHDRESETNKIIDEKAAESSQETAQENVAANIVALAYQPAFEPVQEDIDATAAEPICVVKCVATQEYKATETSTSDLSGNTVLPSALTGDSESKALKIESEESAISAEVTPDVQFAIKSEYHVVQTESDSLRRNKKDERKVKDAAPTQSLEIEKNTGESEIQLTQPVKEIADTKLEFKSDTQSPKFDDSESQVQLATDFQQSSPSLNRRAERLAENRLGEDSAREASKENFVDSTEPILTPVEHYGEPSIEAFSQAQSSFHEAKLSDMQPMQLASALSTPPNANAPLIAQPITSSVVANEQKSSEKAASTNVMASTVAKSASVATMAGPSVGTPGSITTPQTLGKSSTGPNNATSYQRLDRSIENESLTAYQQTRLLQRVLKGLERFGDGSSSVRLRLHPPELGALEMSLHMNQQQLSATVMVDSESVRQVLQDNLQQLQSKLTEQGITIEKFEFRVQTTQQSNSSGENSQQFSNSDSQAGADRDSRQGRDFGQARSNWLTTPSVNESNSSLLEVASNPSQRWISASNINIRA